MRLFVALFKGVSARLVRLVFERCFEKTHRAFRSAIENLRLGSINSMVKTKVSLVFQWLTTQLSTAWLAHVRYPALVVSAGASCARALGFSMYM